MAVELPDDAAVEKPAEGCSVLVSDAKVDLGFKVELLAKDKVVVIVVGSSEPDGTPVASVFVVAEPSPKTCNPEDVPSDVLSGKLRLAMLEIVVIDVALLATVLLVKADRQPPAKDKIARDPVTTVGNILSRG